MKNLKKDSVMKRNIFLLLILPFIFSACGFEDEEVSLGTTITYFQNQEYNRNIVVGEGLKLKAGIMFSGLVNNPRNRVVNYVIDPAIVTNPAKTVLPSNYYTLSDATKFLIPKGEEQGYVTITIDSAAFLADPKAMTGEYVIPFRLTSTTDVDSINAGKNSMIVSISYWAKQHGNYNYSGRTVRKSGTTTETVTYKYNPTISESIR